jgi:hypothetical protein
MVTIFAEEAGAAIPIQEIDSGVPAHLLSRMGSRSGLNSSRAVVQLRPRFR